MVESTTETLPSADITEPNVPSNTSKIKRKVRQIKLMQDNLSLKLTLHLMKQINRSKADTAVSNKPSTSASSETKDKATSTEDSQKADMATADTKDNQQQLVQLQM